jgi:hypothetical protein
MPRRSGQIGVPCRHHDTSASGQRRSEVDRVERPQRVALSEVASLPSQFLAQVEDMKLSPSPPELQDSIRMAARSEAPVTRSGSQRYASLRECDPTGRQAIRLVPQVMDFPRALLHQKELQEGRGIEIDDHSRCSLTSSDTLPLTGILRPSDAARLGSLGGCTRPMAISRSRGRLAVAGMSRATGRPRSVIRTSRPPFTTSSHRLSWFLKSRMPTSMCTSSPISCVQLKVAQPIAVQQVRRATEGRALPGVGHDRSPHHRDRGRTRVRSSQDARCREQRQLSPSDGSPS